MRDLLRGLLRRAELAGDLNTRGGSTFGRSAVRGWPSGVLDRLLGLGVVRAVPRAAEIERPGCERGCLVAADFERDRKTGREVSVHRCRFGCGRAAVPAEEFDRWALDLFGLARAIAAAVDASGEVIELAPGRLVSIGLVGESALSRQVFVGLGLCWPDAAELLARQPRFLESDEPLVLCVGARPSRGVWPGSMRPAWAVLAEHIEINGRGLALDLSRVLGQETVPHPKAKSSRWLTHKEAALLLKGVISGISFDQCKARVSIAARRDAFKTDGKQGRGLRIDAASFHAWLEKERGKESRRSDDTVMGRASKRVRVTRGWNGARG